MNRCNKEILVEKVLCALNKTEKLRWYPQKVILRCNVSNTFYTNPTRETTVNRFVLKLYK